MDMDNTMRLHKCNLNCKHKKRGYCQLDWISVDVDFFSNKTQCASQEVQNLKKKRG